MNKYKATLTATFEIRAENIVEARRLAANIRTVKSDLSGCRRPEHNRDSIRYSVSSLDRKMTVNRIP